MPVFKYSAIGAGGKANNGLITADTPQQARELLRDKGVFPTTLRELSGFGAARGLWARLFRRNSQRDLTISLRLLGNLLKTGVPLAKALELVQNQTTAGGMKEILQIVHEDVISGSSLANALRKHSDVFKEFHVSMVSAGEESGTLPGMLQRLSQYMKTQGRLKSKLTTVMVYPLVLAVVGVCVVAFLLTSVVPKITGCLTQKNAVLPLPTQVLLAVSDFMGHFWWLVLLALVGGIFVFRRLLAQPAFRRKWDEKLLKVPVLGELLKAAMLSRFAVTLSTLMESGIPAVQSLELAKGLVGNLAFGDFIGEATEKIRNGRNISEAMTNPDFVPGAVVHVISIGEQSGELPQVLGELATDFDEDLTTAMERFASLLEPLMIVVMAIVIGFIVLAIVLPIIQMSTLL